MRVVVIVMRVPERSVHVRVRVLVLVACVRVCANKAVVLATLTSHTTPATESA